MALDDVQNYVKTYRAKPGATIDQIPAVARGGRYGELMVSPISGKPRYGLADEGSYFMATNPTPGTGIAGIAATGAFSDQESLLYVKNTATVADGTRLYLDWLRLLVTAAGTNGTDVRWVSKIEPSGTARRGTGGSDITPVQVNPQSSATTIASVSFGALATAAAGSAKLVDHGLIRNVITVVGDTYLFDFGGDADLGHGLITSGTAIAHLRIGHAPIILGPGDQFVMSVHQTAQTAASSFEFAMGWYER